MLRELLGYDNETIASLERSGVITSANATS